MNPLHHPSLELQIKLKKIGFTNCNTVTDTCGNYIRHTPGFDTGEYNPCPSVMEILDVIPKEFLYKGDTMFLTLQYLNDGKHCVAYKYEEDNTDDIYYHANRISDSFPNALASMILWLVENKHLSFDK